MNNVTTKNSGHTNEAADSELDAKKSPSSADASSTSYDASRAMKKTKKASGAFRTISEVADLLDVQQHVLRFWETKFNQVRPLKRGGGRRYYRPEDVALLQHIHHLLYTDGYTIKGVQKLLKGQGKAKIVEQAAQAANSQNATAPSPKVPAPQQTAEASNSSKANLSDNERSALEVMLEELKTMRSMISTD